MPSVAVFDIEADPIPSTQIYCIAVKVDDQPTRIFTQYHLAASDGTLRQAIDLINSCDYCVGHNIISYDLPTIARLIAPITAQPLDTLILSKLMYTKDQLISMDIGIPSFPKELYGSFSLGAFGHRFSDYKGDFHDWSRLSTEMLQYCIQDVDLTHRLFTFLQSSPLYPPQQVIDLEQQVGHILQQQESNGFYFDIDRARDLNTRMLFKRMQLEHQLAAVFRPVLVASGKEVIPARDSSKRKHWLPNPSYEGF